MFRPRIIPCLLLKNKGLVKTIKFKNATYIGDPINAVRIFNLKEADELIFLDITASLEKRCISFDLVKQIGNEAYMPFAVGGGIKNIEQIKKLIHAGAEKVVLNTSTFENPQLITEAARVFGSQSIVVSIDVKKNFLGKHEAYILSGTKKINSNPIIYAKEIENRGAGEIILTSIDNDGTMQGYDIAIVRKISEAVNIPVIANGGAGKFEDLKEAVIKGKASAAASGSLFIYYGPRKAVLINYPTKEELKKVFK